MILHPYTRTREAEQAPTWAYLRGIGYPVLDVLCEAEGDYAAALLAHWNDPGDLVIIEQDIVPPAGMLADFDCCVWGACTGPYLLRGGAVSLIDPVTRIALPGAPIDYRDAMLPVISGLGCVRLRRGAREAMSPDRFVGSWHGLDERVSRALIECGSAWHVHEPVAHTGRP